MIKLLLMSNIKSVVFGIMEFNAEEKKVNAKGRRVFFTRLCNGNNFKIFSFCDIVGFICADLVNSP